MSVVQAGGIVGELPGNLVLPVQREEEALLAAIPRGVRERARQVLMALRGHCFGTKWQCWPSVALLVEETGYSRRSVQYAFVDLEKVGLLRRRFKKIRADWNGPTRYELPVLKLVKEKWQQAKASVKSRTKTGFRKVLDAVAPSDPCRPLHPEQPSAERSRKNPDPGTVVRGSRHRWWAPAAREDYGPSGVHEW